MILEAVGEDVNREGLLDTPKRVAKCMLKCSAAYMRMLRIILKRCFMRIMKN